MAVLINWKICDNSKDCGGTEACRTGALSWDEKKKTIVIDNSKCVSCRQCEKGCPVGAIMVAATRTEYKRLKKKIDEDSREVSDLFTDRYGAEPVNSAFLIPEKKFHIQIIEASKPAVAEFFNEKSIHCLLYSIPVRDVFVGENIKYRKVELKGEVLLKKYKIKTLPSLLFFKNGKLIDKIEGYYEIGKKKELVEKVKRIMPKVKK